MASISRQKNGRRTIQFVARDGKRKSIRLGKVSQRIAEAVKIKVEQLNAAALAGHSPDDETARWLAEIDQSLCEKLANVGLVAKREHTTLCGFVDGYIKKRTDVQDGTAIAYRQARGSLVEFFGTEKLLRDITAGDAEEWRLYLAEKGYSEATIGRRCKYAKQFSSAAVRRKIISENPFSELRGGSQENTTRYYFISREETERILAACPDVQWRLLFALSRFGGLRCPSEHLALRWGDVDWERARLTVTSPKTRRHPGGETRQIPIFPELRTYLEEVYEQAEPGTEFVITRYRRANANLRTQLQRIIRRAGLLPWPKLFQNLRSTRETELAEQFPLHVVCAWIGNSQPVAAKHYLQLTDEHFERAAQGAAESGARAVQKAVQQPAAPNGTDSHKMRGDAKNSENCGIMPLAAIPCDVPGFNSIGPQGFEPRTKGL